MNNLPSRHHGSERKAPRPARSTVAIPLRVGCRTPAGSRVPVQRSERTTSREDPCISSTSDRTLCAAKTLNSKVKNETMEGDYPLCRLRLGPRSSCCRHRRSAGLIVADFEIEHNASGWQRWREQVAALGPGVAVCVETSQGMVIEQLLESGVSLYPISPVSSKAYRERKAPSGNKTDHLDAWSLADALRVDGHGWRALAKEDPLVAELRLLCRDEVALIEERTALVNQLQSALHEYYPAALEAFEDWTLPGSLGLSRSLSHSSGAHGGRQTQMGKVPPQPQAGAAANLCQTHGDLRAGQRVRLWRSAHPHQEPTGAHPHPDAARARAPDRGLPRRNREALCPASRSPSLSVRCPERVPKSPRACWAKSARIARALTPTPYRLWPAPRRSAINPGRSTTSLCAATAISRSRAAVHLWANL